KVVEIVKKPLTATIIEEIKAPPAETVIANVAPTPPTTPVVIAPPAPVVAPPAPPKPAIRQGASCSKRDPPVFPREALRAQIQKGRVTAVLTIDEKGNVTDVRIVAASPPRVFDRAVQDALVDWKCNAEGTKYQASVEVNFTTTD
ncbi:MAG: TonB family protein, partial [Burkholderiales bacterium]